MARVLVVLNPGARDGSRSELRTHLERTFFRHDLRIETPPNAGAAAALLRAASAERYDLVAVAGGDGTVNHALQALAGSDVPLGVLPAGTANDLAEELELPRDLERACEVLKLRKVRALDLLEVAGRLFVTSGGAGLASDVAADVNRFKASVASVPGARDLVRSLGKELYSLFLIRELVFPDERAHRLALAWDGGERTFDTALLMVNNQPLVGGTFPLAPRTRNDDGTFCASVFLEIEPKALAATTASIRSGAAPSPAAIFQVETTRLRIRALDGRPLRFFGDGELLAEGTDLDVSIRPAARRVVVP